MTDDLEYTDAEVMAAYHKALVICVADAEREARAINASFTHATWRELPPEGITVNADTGLVTFATDKPKGGFEFL